MQLKGRSHQADESSSLTCCLQRGSPDQGRTAAAKDERVCRAAGTEGSWGVRADTLELRMVMPWGRRVTCHSNRVYLSGKHKLCSGRYNKTSEYKK